MKEDSINTRDEIVIPVSGDNEEDRNDINIVEDSDSAKDDVAGQYKDQLQRLQAEFSNYKRRVEKERECDFKSAKSLIVQNLLPVLDDFERMVDHHENEMDCNLEGVQLIYQKLKKILLDEKLEEIVSVGHLFDPEYHEAVSVLETLPEKDGIVLEEWQKGYKFAGKLIRPSRVTVGKGTENRGDR